MKDYKNMTIEELKKERKDLCYKKSAIESKLDRQAFDTDVDYKEIEELNNKSEECSSIILLIDSILDEKENQKNKNINRR